MSGNQTDAASIHWHAATRMVVCCEASQVLQEGGHVLGVICSKSTNRPNSIVCMPAAVVLLLKVGVAGLCCAAHGPCCCMPAELSSSLTLTCTSSPSTQWFSRRLHAPTMLSQPIMLLSTCSNMQHGTRELHE